MCDVHMRNVKCGEPSDLIPGFTSDAPRGTPIGATDLHRLVDNLAAVLAHRNLEEPRTLDNRSDYRDPWEKLRWCRSDAITIATI